MSFSFTLDPRSLTIEHDSSTGYDWLRYPDLTSPMLEEWEGSPLLPVIQKPVLLPEGKRVAELLVVVGEPIDIPGEILPVPMPGTRDDGTSDWVPDPIYYQDGQVFPPTPQFLTANESFREFRVASFVAIPFEWRGDTRTLRMYQTVDVTLRLEDAPVADRLPRRLRHERRFSQDGWEISWIAEHVINPEDMGPLYPTDRDSTLGFTMAEVETTETPGFHPTDRPSLEGSPVEMVIITADAWTNGQTNSGDMVPSFQVLADWRTKTGRPTAVRTVSWIRANYPGSDDQEKMRNFLKDAYSRWATDYVILGGDHRAVPTRVMRAQGNMDDPPSDWYYAALDGTWNPERDAYFNWNNVWGIGDNYPELWVGRLPARDVNDADVMVQKILAYERSPESTAPTPGTSFYTRAIVAAGLTNSGDWNPPPPPANLKWSNGIYTAEQIKALAFDHPSVGFTTQRLYPVLSGNYPTCGIQSLDCYDRIRNAFPIYPPGPVFTAQALLNELNGNPGSSFFHIEHSHWHLMGGPVDPGVPPATTTCTEDQGCTSECGTWANNCVQAYNSNNVNAHFTREWAEQLSNGPAYFVGMTYGSLTTRHDLDTVTETLLRDPDGGAVSMIGKSHSSGWDAPSTGNHLAISVNYFINSLVNRQPVSVALYGALLTYAQGGGDPVASRAFHLLGDPTLRAWSKAPTALSATVVPATLGSPGIKKFEVTVTEFGTGVPVNGARVCLYRSGNVFATTLTKSNGKATFPGIMLMDITNPVDVHITADNRIPKKTQILTGGGSIEAKGLTYSGHTWVDTLAVGLQTDFAEAGDEVSFGLKLKSNGHVPVGSIKLAATPRVRATAKFGATQTFDASRIYIGKSNANPPALPDTFNLYVNEYGIRPEDSPTTNPTTSGLVWIWRDSNFVYHVKTRYVAGEPNYRYRVLLRAEGGMEWLNQTTEPSDTVLVTGGSIDCRLYPDGTDDEVTFRAEAKDWVQWVTNTDTYASCAYGQIVNCHVRTRFLPATPARTRLNFTISAGLYSDFYFDVHAPRVGLVLMGTPILNSTSCQCGTATREWFVYPRFLNTGDAAADSVEAGITINPSSVPVCTPKVWLQIAAGAEASSTLPLRFCTNEPPVGIFSSVVVQRRVNGVWLDSTTYSNIYPWGHTRELPWALADANLGGFRLSWAPPSDTTGIRGYHVFMDSAGVQTRLRTDLGTAATQWTVRSRISDFDYRFGVCAVDANFTQGPIKWTTVSRTNLPERANWPKRVPRGSTQSVTLVNLDGDSASELVIGGKTIVAWNGDGSTATTDPSGVVYDPYPTGGPSGETIFSFNGALAAHDIDNDGIVEIVGSHGDGYLYCVEADGGPYEWRKSCLSQSGPTLANLDRVGDYEVILNSYPDSKVYVFNANGTGYRCTDGLFADVGDPAMKYSFSGVAVGDLDNDAAHTLEIVHTGNSGKAYAWKSVGWSGCTGLPPQLWQATVSTNNVSVSTPVITRIPTGTGSPMVIVGADGANNAVASFLGTTGVLQNNWTLTVDLPGACETYGADAYPVAVPSVADFHSPADGNPEIVWPTWVEGSSPCPSHFYDPRTYVAVLSRYGTVTTEYVAADSLPVPGGEMETYAKTIGQPILGDIDGDGKTEILAISNQSALFCWEARWNATTNQFEYVAEKGWPIVFNEQPTGVAVGEIDGTDALAELVVTTDDGYVHTYDLPGLSASSSQPWSTYAHDARRTGNTEGGGTGPVQDPNPREDLALSRTPTLDGRDATLRPGDVIAFQVPGAGDVVLSIYDASGRRVRRLIDGIVSAGSHEVRWPGTADDGRRVSSGVYFLRLEAGGFEVSRRVVWLR